LKFPKNDITENDDLIEADYQRKLHASRPNSGLITGRGNGDWGRVTVKTDGSIVLENVDLSNIQIRNCNLFVESGENPIPYADRSNRLSDYIAFAKEHYDATLHAGHTHNFNDPMNDEGICICGRSKTDGGLRGTVGMG
jgi:predicted phosphodiesterase